MIEPLLYSAVCLLCRAALWLWCHLYHLRRLKCRTQKIRMRLQRHWKGLSGILLIHYRFCSLSKYNIVVKATIFYLERMQRRTFNKDNEWWIVWEDKLWQHRFFFFRLNNFFNMFYIKITNQQFCFIYLNFIEVVFWK